MEHAQAALLRVYMAGKMVLRHGSGGDNKVPGKSYRPFDILLDGDKYEADHPHSPVARRELHGVAFLYTGPWQAVGSYHGLIHGITDCGGAEPRGIVARAQHGIQQCDLCFALLDGADCYGTIAEIGYAKGLGKPLIVGIDRHAYNDHDDPRWADSDDGSCAEQWFAGEMADVQLRGGVTEILRQFAALLGMCGTLSRPVARALLRSV